MSSRRSAGANGAATSSLFVAPAGRSPRALRRLGAGGRRSEPDWPPQMSAVGLIDGIRRRGSTGQLFVTKNHVWVRTQDEA